MSEANQVCERCGSSFHCGAKEQQCWCMSVKIEVPKLSELRAKFKLCLCPSCLENAANNQKDLKDAND